jgi:hypothetical protein
VSDIRSNWTRFTLMDGIILIAACSVGTYIATRIAQMDARNSSPRVAVLWAVSCVLWSGVIAAPLVLSSQRLRGRRSAPSPGEWLWLVPLVLSLTVAWMLLRFCGPGSFLLVILVMLQCACSCAALFRLVRTFFGMNRDVACRWTDLLGCTVCGSVGPAILFEIYEALKQL